MELGEYYRNRIVRNRIAEFCGGDEENPASFSSYYLVGYGKNLAETSGLPFLSFEKKDFSSILDRGLDIYRAVWDEKYLLAVLDVEYFNQDFPGEVYLNPGRVFSLMEPVCSRILEIFRSFNINPGVTMTGQGYHFVFKIRKGSPVHESLEKAGHVEDSLRERYQRIRGKKKSALSVSEGKAFDGMGRVLEFAGHRIKRELGEAGYPLPVQLTDVAVGKGERGREAVSIDLSMYGDPLYMRDIRCPFSTHQKHKVDVWKVGKKISREIPVQVALPR
ncbi:MAG TPA: hypothetical protein VJC03_08495, partial [bacterium]|nr:hypothetical protein [bacterium]